MPGNNEIPVFVRILGDAKDVSKKLGDVNREVKSFVGNVEAAGARGAAAFGVFGAALTATALSSFKVSAELQTIRTRMDAVTKSSALAQQTFQNAISMAGSGAMAFPTASIAQAATNLTVFKQNVQTTLPVIADFAAAMGKDIGEETDFVKKALEGGAKGFKMLAKQADISGADLKKFGAVLKDGGTELNLTGANADKASQALLRLLNFKYGGAAQAQANTLSGSLQVLKNVASETAGGFTSGLVPAATLAVNISTVTTLPPPQPTQTYTLTPSVNGTRGTISPSSP